MTFRDFFKFFFPSSKSTFIVFSKRIKIERFQEQLYFSAVCSLQEYMVYRKHTYMRLDGSSKISERRDMVADFQNR